MSNAIAQSATQLSVSNYGGEWVTDDYVACVKRNAERAHKGTVRERQFLNFNKLISACCADYRGHHAAIYGKTERLPREIYDQIEKAVTDFINGQLARINTTNVLNLRRGFFHNFREAEVTERVTITGENKLPLDQQRFGCITFIEAANRRLKMLEAKPTPDYDREKSVKQQIMQLNVTLAYIDGEIANQAKLAQESK